MNSMNFYCKAFSRTVSEEEVLSSDDFAFVDDIITYLGHAVTEVKAELKNVGRRAAAYGEYMSPHDYEMLERKRRDLGAFHQRVILHGRKLRRLREGCSDSSSIEHFFFQAAKEVLKEDSFQRLFLIAERRRLMQMQSKENSSHET